MVSQIDSLKAQLDESFAKKKENSLQLFELDQAHRKLLKDNKELLKKHEQVCSELRVAKDDKEKIAKESSSLSVALKNSKKTMEESLESFRKETQSYRVKLEKLNLFKLEREAELKASRKAEKKKRQKDKKKSISAVADLEIKTELPVCKNISDDVDAEQKILESLKVDLDQDEFKAMKSEACDTFDENGNNSTNALENNSGDESEDNYLDELTTVKEVKDPVIEEDNRLTKAWLKEYLDKFKAENGI